MIVNRGHATDALADLGMAQGPDEYTAADLKAAYRFRAGLTHPDREGGSIEAFAVVDRAKHVLEAWLAKRSTEARLGLVAPPCVRCGGTGRIKVHKGFKFYLVKCVTCNGTGDGGYDHDRAGSKD